MHLAISNQHSLILEATDRELSLLADYLTFEDQKRAFVYRHGRPKRVTPPKIHLYDPRMKSFPTGVLPLVEAFLRDHGHRVGWEDFRTAKLPLLPAPIYWLRPYQKDALDAAIRNERGILWIPTGGGKTECAIALARCLSGRWLFLVHSKDIALQTVERFNLRSKEHNITYNAEMLDTAKVDLDRDIYFIVTTHQKIAAGTKKGCPATKRLLEDAQGLVVDECHSVPADRYYTNTITCKARYRIGLSGTPLARGDKRSLMAIAALGPVIYRLKSVDLVTDGTLARPIIKMLEVNQTGLDGIATWAGVYRNGVVNSRQRNTAIVELLKKTKVPAIVFVKDIKHGDFLYKLFNSAGYRVRFVYGNTTQRQAVAESLERGDLDVVVASVVWQEGIDIPNVKSLIIACGGKSTIAALQRLGRGMRKTATKSYCSVIDFDDYGHRMLEKHSRLRRKAYQSEGFTVHNCQ
jgi:superfamily II DNA or RNA helicase